jgi:cytidylate kinase
MEIHEKEEVMPHQLIPSVEKRISSWIDIQKKQTQQEMNETTPKLTITLSREFGCEGYPLAEVLKTKLDNQTGQIWTIFDNKFVEKLVADHEISRHLVKSFGDRAKYLDYIISTLLPDRVSDSDAFKLMVETIYSIAQQGNAIILERGAFAITKNLSNCFSFRLIASLDYRAGSYSRRTGVSKTEAEKLVVEKEQDRTRFLSDFLNCNFEQDSFHMIFNNGKFPIEKIADLIIDTIEL